MLGASFDTPAQNRAFATAQGFPFHLLSDADHAVGREYGTERPVGGFGFARRLTFLIDPEGVIRRTYRVKDVAAHPAEVLDDIRALSAAQE